MSLLRAKNYCVASAVEAKVTYNGAPVVGATVIRKIGEDDIQTYTTTTDQDGVFRLPAEYQKIRHALPLEVYGRQQIYVRHKEQEYLIWTGAKMGEEEYAEWRRKGEEPERKPNNIRCELTNDLARVNLERAFIGTVCEWD